MMNIVEEKILKNSLEIDNKCNQLYELYGDHFNTLNQNIYVSETIYPVIRIMKVIYIPFILNNTKIYLPLQ